MRIKLLASKIENLLSCLSRISNLRKHVVLCFSPEQLTVILINSSSITQEPQVWCKFPMRSIFLEIEISSVRDNKIYLEINIELFLQTLRNFDKDSSHELSIRLQKKEGPGRTRSAYLALFYSGVSINETSINHTFRIPIKILKVDDRMMQEPALPRIDLMTKLPSEFSAIYRRLEKFKGSAAHDRLILNAVRRDGGSLKFILREAGGCGTTIKWNDKLEILRPPATISSDSLRAALIANDGDYDEEGLLDEVNVIVNLKDWCMAARIVSSCQSLLLYLCDNNACVIHCVLDDMGEAEVTYYISGVRHSELDSD